MDFDVIVVGAGLVGASFALALHAAGLRIAVVETRVPPPPPTGAQDWDSRIYAISPGSATFLQACGAWDGLDAARPGETRLEGTAPGTWPGSSGGIQLAKEDSGENSEESTQPSRNIARNNRDQGGANRCPTQVPEGLERP